MCDHHPPSLSRRSVLAAGAAAAVLPWRMASAATPWPNPDWGAFAGATVIGESSQGRPIHVVRRTGVVPTARVLVVGVVHGHEPIGAALAARMLAPEFGWPDWLDLHWIPVANPDGYAKRSRRNGNGIDLNRDGRQWWKAKPRDGGPPGKTPESQPETQVVLGYARSMPAPALSIWIHQNLAWVAPVVGPNGVPTLAKNAAASYRKIVKLPNRRSGMVAQSGGLETTASFDVGPAILVEGAGLALPTTKVLDRHAGGLLAAITSLPH